MMTMLLVSAYSNKAMIHKTLVEGLEFFILKQSCVLTEKCRTKGLIEQLLLEGLTFRKSAFIINHGEYFIRAKPREIR